MTVLYPDIPVRSTIADCYAELKEKFFHIIVLCALPYTLSVGLYLAADQVIILNLVWLPNWVIQTAEVLVVNLIIQCWMAIALYRLLLLDRFEIIPDLSPAGIERYWRFLKSLTTIVLMMLPLYVVGIVLWLVLWSTLPILQPFIFWFCTLATLLAFMRLGFVFPATAVDAPYTLADSWLTSRAVNIKLLLISAGTIIPPFFVLMMVRQTIDRYYPMILDAVDEYGSITLTKSYFVFAFAGMLLSFMIVVGLVTVSAIVFYIRTGWRPGATRVA